MDIEDYEKFYHVDISTQIENKWKTDTVLGIVKDSIRYSIKIKNKDKLILKKRFITNSDSKDNKKHNKRVVAIIYSYLLYQALCDLEEAKPLLLCRDVRPERFVISYLTKISNFFENNEIIRREIKFRKRKNKQDEKLPKSLAGRYVRKVYQGKIDATRILKKEEIDEIAEIISKII